MKHTLNVIIPAYVAVEIPDDTEVEDRDSVAAEIFQENPEDYIVYADSGAKNICNPRDAEVDN